MEQGKMRDTNIAFFIIINLFFSSESLLSASSPNADNRSTSNSNNSKAEITDVYDSNNKCPICFMIFPLHMSANDRHQHVDEHMPDGENANFTTM
jgi:hypothetical protein